MHDLKHYDRNEYINSGVRGTVAAAESASAPGAPAPEQSSPAEVGVSASSGAAGAVAAGDAKAAEVPDSPVIPADKSGEKETGQAASPPPPRVSGPGYSPGYGFLFRRFLVILLIIIIIAILVAND